eukprot:5373706-Ditylum_brightwellii.AAC.1
MSNIGKEPIVDALEEASEGINAETGKDTNAKDNQDAMDRDSEPLKEKAHVSKEKEEHMALTPSKEEISNVFINVYSKKEINYIFIDLYSKEGGSDLFIKCCIKEEKSVKFFTNQETPLSKEETSPIPNHQK